MRHDHRIGSTDRRRIGLVYRSAEPTESAWSGIPSGLARGLGELGFSVDLVSAEPRSSVGRAAKAWARVVRRHRYGGLYAPEVRNLRRLVARRRASTFEPWDGVVQMGSDYGVPFPENFVTYEDMTVRQFVRVFSLESVLGTTAVSRWIAAQAECYAAARGCCVTSRWAAESVVGDYGIDAGKVHVVGIGRNYEPRPAPRDWSQPRFLFVGYDWDRKNGPMLLRTFARLREEVPSARLDLVGGHPPTRQDGVVAHGVLDFSDSGERVHVQSLLESATCYVMPSRFEPLGMVYIEAGAAGVPSIATAVGGAPEVIGEQGGIVVDPDDEAGLLDAMRTMCDPERASTMGEAAQVRSMSFTWRAVAERIGRVLELADALAVEPQRAG